MKEKRPQFLKMNASREENPPPRNVGCPNYRSCLTEAAFRNFCLDCSLCDALDPIHSQSPPQPRSRPHKDRGLPARLSLPG
jgi:hypothetical protein